MPDKEKEPWVCRKCEGITCRIQLVPECIDRSGCVLAKRYVLIDITDGSVVGEYAEPPTPKDRELTKIMAVPCRDCKATMTVLAGASANIMDARCPRCTANFRKEGEEYNKRIGYPVTLEPVGDLAMNTLANNAVSGLEYVLQGEALPKGEVSDRGNRVVGLLQDGITFCDNIVETEESKAIKNALLKIVRVLKLLVDEKAKGYKGQRADEMLYAHIPKYSEQEIRRMQHFFNETSTPYLRKAMNESRRRHEARGR